MTAKSHTGWVVGVVEVAPVAVTPQEKTLPDTTQHVRLLNVMTSQALAPPGGAG